MAEILDSFIPRTCRGVYDWDTLLDGKTRRLFQGKDFPGKADNFRVALYQKAKQRGLGAHVSVAPDGSFVDLCTYSNNGVEVMAKTEKKKAAPKKAVAKKAVKKSPKKAAK